MQATNLLSDWGKRLAEVRRAKGLSIGELARQVGMHKSHLARFERGEAGIGDELRIRVASEVGQQVADLFPYPDTTDQESPCPAVASATEPAASAPAVSPTTHGTTGHPSPTRSPAPSAPVPGASASTETRATAELGSGDR